MELGQYCRKQQVNILRVDAVGRLLIGYTIK
jgi:hypothetical protein